MKKNKPCSVELALLHALRYEKALIENTTNFKQRWDIDAKEMQTVVKWMTGRIKDITDRL